MRSALLAVALAAAACGSAAAQPAALATDEKTITDVRCILVAGSLSQSTDPDLQKLGQVSLVYFLGRIEGRGTEANLAANIADQAAKMTGQDLSNQAKTCGALFSAAGDRLRDLDTAVRDRQGTAVPPSK
jgi:hypothetical protein